MSGLLLVLAALQGAALAVLLARLAGGRTRTPPLAPLSALPEPTRVSAVVPTLNEEARIGPCLEGLHAQGPELVEVIVVDSRSTDGTVAQVEAMAKRDRRFKVVYDDPLPTGWVGRPWALQSGFLRTDPASEWVLGIDADTLPLPGLVNAIVAAARAGNYDALSLSPRFLLVGLAEFWLQPALLITLVYRFGAAGGAGSPRPERVMANGQCSLLRRQMLVAMDGYTAARRSFCDDVTLARSLAARGVRVGFLDGAQLIKVRMYSSALETWNEWGRSLDLKDASTPGWQVFDCLFLVLALGLPIPVLALATAGLIEFAPLIWVNGLLVAIRLLLLFAIAGSYERLRWSYWLSPLADPLAALRIVISSLTVPRRWRGRNYDNLDRQPVQ
ncbi:glycosyltransferase [Gloeobacter kilaueensis]|uniref:Glycosyl transferase family 2 n=1 Tax=Gloeobacter kilaueensis (strain ATCC BAA-2537 / CCAP 1431/1 / ULC 316 / JS1) TaxID=1183438 RepID=U5QHD8_GLOK1|nr:glycosyltransferase family 2 protein [Gloeobacter kilaueensis]AGY57054.1 glycosyl transferase family 2 [Gloeobacter kilaueensis JS1]